MRHTFSLMCTWTHTTVEFGARRVLEVIHEKPLHARWDTVWWEFWAGRLIGPYFFENEAGNAVTVNGVPYRNMITEFLWPQFGRYGYGRRGCSRTAQPVTLRAKQLSCCEKNFQAVSSHAMAIRIGHWGHAIWHRATYFFRGLWNLVSMPTNHKQFLGSRRRFDVSLAKLSRSFAEMSPRVSSKEQECASRVVEDICRILCSTINRSVSTLYRDKNINTFLNNWCVLLQNKAYAVVGTRCIMAAVCTE